MPHFDDYYADKLRGSQSVAEAGQVLDLRGRGGPEAEAALDALLALGAEGSTVAIRLDPPREGGGETLFQPIGRRLLAAKREGRVAHLQTLPAADGLGFFVVIGA